MTMPSTECTDFGSDSDTEGDETSVCTLLRIEERMIPGRDGIGLQKYQGSERSEELKPGTFSDLV